jgi:hypothetical protein
LGARESLLTQTFQRLAHGWFTDRFQENTTSQEDSSSGLHHATAFFYKYFVIDPRKIKLLVLKSHHGWKNKTSFIAIGMSCLQKAKLYNRKKQNEYS